ncbi:MAG: hypothetical protein ISQ02_09060 [Pseudomonadales bacterium]|nr:hypothetical protein [Pseudomonadales bacterium]
MALRPAALASLCLSLLLGGCTTTAVTVEATFPERPVVEQLPLEVAVVFDEAFQSYTLSESIPQRGDWEIDLGAAQVALFRAMLPALFSAVTERDVLAPEPEDSTADLLLRPQLQDMQFSIPYQTRSNFFEVWLKYEIELYERDGQALVARYPLTGYGRTRDGFLDSAQVAIEQAAVTALRDAGAFFAIEFPRNQDSLEAARVQAQQRQAEKARAEAEAEAQAEAAAEEAADNGGEDATADVPTDAPADAPQSLREETP